MTSARFWGLGQSLQDDDRNFFVPEIFCRREAAVAVKRSAVRIDADRSGPAELGNASGERPDLVVGMLPGIVGEWFQVPHRPPFNGSGQQLGQLGPGSTHDNSPSVETRDGIYSQNRF